MKKWLWLIAAVLLTLVLAPAGFVAAKDEVPINATNFPDSIFRSYISSTFDKDKNGALDPDEIVAAEVIDVSNKGITSLQGVEILTSLKKLNCYGNKLKELNLGPNEILGDLNCGNNLLTTLDVSDHYALKSLNVRESKSLTTVNCETCALAYLYVDDCPKLSSLNCGANKLTSLNVSGCTALSSLNCYFNQLKSLDVSKNTALRELACAGNDITELNLQNNKLLETLDFRHSDVTELNLSGLVKLSYVNLLQSLKLKSLDCSRCNLSTLIVEGCSALEELDCSRNNLKKLDLSGCTVLEEVDCGYNTLYTLTLEDCTALRSINCGHNQLTSLGVGKNKELVSLLCAGNLLTGLDVRSNTKLNTLDVRNNENLSSLNCFACALTKLNVSGCPALSYLNCGKNQLTSLDVSDNRGLTGLYCYSNQLTSLDVSNAIGLKTLSCYGNRLDTLILNENKELEKLSCYGNRITVLYLASCPHILDAYHNGSRSQDVSADGAYFWSYELDSYFLEVDKSTEIRTSGFQWTRLAGSDRYATMAMASKKAFEEHSCKTIIVATGQAFPDALAGSALAGVYGCPIILTKTSALSPQAAEELRRLAASSCKVLILGGNGAVSEAVENAILDLPGLITYTVERVKGSNREATALAVYENGKAAGGFKSGGTVIIATGYSFADALSVSPYAYASKTPILLAKKDGSLGADTKALIKSEGFKKAIIIGGNGAVSEATENYLKKTCKMQVLRLSGSNRYETSANILKWELGKNSGAAFQPAVSMTLEGLGTATGSKFADALGAVSLLGKTASPLLLVSDSNKTNKSATQANIKAIVKPGASSMTKGYIFGGKGAVSLQIEGWLNNAVK